MKIDWPDERCIICLGTPRCGDLLSQRDDAHVIPRSIGGKLSSPFLCKRCNSDMGGKLEGQLPKEVVILDLVDRLQDQLPPKLSRGIVRNAGYFVDIEEFGLIDGRFSTDGVLTPKESENIRSERNALRQIEKVLRQSGADEMTVRKKVAEFVKADFGASVEVLRSLTFVKGVSPSDGDWKRSYDEPIVSWAVPLGIAYLYLALCIGGHIYGKALESTRVTLRRAMAGEIATTDEWPFEPMRAQCPPEAKHALWVTQETDGVLVKIALFRECVWPVRFSGVSLRGPAPSYLVDLMTGEESCAP